MTKEEFVDEKFWEYPYKHILSGYYMSPQQAIRVLFSNARFARRFLNKAHRRPHMRKVEQKSTGIQSEIQ